MKASNTRWSLWLALLSGAAWLALFGDKTPAHGEQGLPTRSAPGANEAAAARANLAPGADDAPVALVPRAQLLGDAAPRAPTGREPFSARSWNPPAPPPALTAPAVAPAVPAMPYAYLGKKLEGGQWEVFLSRGDHSFVVREGQTLESQYRIDSIAPPTLRLTYLPLGEAQTISIGESR